MLIAGLAKADVPAPPTPPPMPAGYCTTISNELNADLQAFNLLLTVPPVWTPVSGPPTVWAANLQVADGNIGTSLASSDYIASIIPQLNEEKALGAQAILLQIGFPLLYAPFQGGESQLQPYLNLYQGVAQAVRALDMKLIVENDILLVGDIQSGWPNLASYFSTLSWGEYTQARATMAATIAEKMQPDYLVVAEEPDTEASNSGQSNLLNAADAAQMVTQEIDAVRASSYPNVQLGAGFGAWPQSGDPNSVAEYTLAYAALPLDFIDSHIYPINNEIEGSLIGNILTIASLSAAAGKLVALSEEWLWKMENSEFNVMTADQLRGRNPFSFWQPLDIYFQQTMQNLAQYTNMTFVAGDGPDYLFANQTYGGTAANGGAANCTCTTAYCDSYDIIQNETVLAKTANDTAAYTNVGLNYASEMVQTPDTVPPSKPSSLTGSAGYTGAKLSWAASTDNVGVAGYNVYRCAPPALGQSCKGVWIANATTPAYNDSGLAPNAPYNYQVQAFDLANNKSALSTTLSLQTYKIPANSPYNLVATAVSAEEIDLSWSPPQNTSGLTEYLILAGPSSTSLVQIATVSSGTTTYRNVNVNPSTYYYYGIEAVENGVDSPMSATAWANTYPLPNAPTSVTATASGATKIVLKWQQTMAKSGLPIDYYKILEGTTPGQLSQIGKATGLTYASKSLEPNTTYYYEIVAVDTAYDNSTPSSEVSATTPQ